MSAPVIWRALQPCMVAGVYREAGEVFEAPDGDYAPDVREKIKVDETAVAAPGVTPAKMKGKPNAAPGVTPDDLPDV